MAIIAKIDGDVVIMYDSQREKSFFLQVLADFLNGIETVVPDNLDWAILKEIGLAQQLNGVIYHQCKKSIAKSNLTTIEKNKWKLSYTYNSFLYSKRLALLEKIESEFQRQNITYLIVKGTEIAKFYPVPEQRTMSDTDLLVHVEDKQRAHDALINLGFNMNTNLPNEWVGVKNKLEIELHHSLIYDKTGEFEYIQAWGDKVWDYANRIDGRIRLELELTYHLLYVLLHLRKHFLFTGVGFRQFMDVAILAVQPEINWNQADLWFKELKLEKFSKVCFAFCQRWFNIKIPFETIKLDEDFYQVTTEKTFTGGLFGTNNKDYKDKIIFNEVRFSKSTGTSYILKRLFLPYKEMCNIAYCSFLIGRPWLLPIAWFWRLMYVFYTGRFIPFVKATVKATHDKTAIKNNEKSFSDWGL